MNTNLTARMRGGAVEYSDGCAHPIDAHGLSPQPTVVDDASASGQTRDGSAAHGSTGQLLRLADGWLKRVCHHRELGCRHAGDVSAGQEPPRTMGAGGRSGPATRSEPVGFRGL